MALLALITLVRADTVCGERAAEKKVLMKTQNTAWETEQLLIRA